MCSALLIVSGAIHAQRLLKDCNSKPSSSYPFYISKFKGGFIFYAETDSLGREIWFSDGKEANTRMLLDANPGSGSSEYELAVSDTSICIFAVYTDHYQLWKTDGSDKGTFKLTDITGNPPIQYQKMFIRYKNKYYFSARDSAGNDLFVSDGTANGTKGFIDLGKNPQIRPTSFINLNDKFYFFSADSNMKNQNIYESDGTSAGTVKIKSDVGQLSATAVSDGKYIYFISLDTVNINTLYRFDPLTHQLDTVFNSISDRLTPTLLLSRNKIYFNTSRQNISSAWYSDGTAQNTFKFTVSDTTVKSVSLYRLYDFPENSLAVIQTDKYGYEYWKMEENGTKAKFILDLFPGNLNGFSSDETPVYRNGKAYFLARNPLTSGSIWSYDLINDNLTVFFSGNSLTQIGQFFEWNHTCYLTALMDNAIGNELYIFDNLNVSVDTKLRKVVQPYPNPIRSGSLLSINNINPSSIFRLYDLNGKFIELKAGIGTVQIPENLPPGTYALCIISDKGIQTTKIIVQ